MADPEFTEKGAQAVRERMTSPITDFDVIFNGKMYSFTENLRANGACL